VTNKAHRGLGRGLDAIFDRKPVVATRAKQEKAAAAGKAAEKVQELPVTAISANRHQPRRDFDEGSLDELMESIKQYGVLQPVLVRRIAGKGYELIAGERRFRAAKQAGLKQVPAILREYSDQQVTEIALIENIQRENLNPIEEAQAYDHLMVDFKLTQDAIAKKVGRSRSHIANFLRLLKLAPKVQAQLENGVLTMGQARPLAALTDIELQAEAAEVISEKELSARECEALVRRLQANPGALQVQTDASSVKKPKDIFLQDAEERLNHIFGTKVQIHPGKKRSRIEIEFYSQEDLERIIEELTERRSAINEKKKDALRKFSQSNKLTV
jgi:ParB family chromosome partitioning protein